MMLDEIDKLGADYRGDPAAALLEILDPEQNNSFTDHYLDLPSISRKFSLSPRQITGTDSAAAARSHGHYRLAGYSDREKLQIAKRYLLPRQIRENGLTPEQIEIADSAIMEIATRYTREAGVRNSSGILAAGAKSRAQNRPGPN
jgi:ATP-dependent Lon protease